jgi:hypothetical protein
MPLVTDERYWALFYMPLVTEDSYWVPFYMSSVIEERYWTLFYMPLYTFIHNLNELVQIANKMGFKKAVVLLGPPLLSSGQCSFLQIQMSGFDSLRYQIFWEAVGLERGPLSLVSTIEGLLERKSSGSVLEIWDYGRWDPSRWPRITLYTQNLALTSLTSGSVGIVRSRT